MDLSTTPFKGEKKIKVRSKFTYYTVPIIVQYVEYLKQNNNGRIYRKRIEALRFYHVIVEYFETNGNSFDLSQLNDHHIEFYLTYLQKRIDTGEINHQTYKVSVNTVNYFITYLISTQLVKVNYTPDYNIRLNKQIHPIILEFDEYLRKYNFKSHCCYVLEANVTAKLKWTGNVK